MGKVATCDREDDLCPGCRKALAAKGVAVPERVVKPWPSPNSALPK